MFVALLLASASAFAPSARPLAPAARSRRAARPRARPSMAATIRAPAAAAATDGASTARTTRLEHPAVFAFGGGDGADGARSLAWLLGGKGANLSEMARIGLSVPPGFTITTEVCAAFHGAMGATLAPDVWASVLAELGRLEAKMGAKLGDARAPLLLSVRSGAAVSMPGMMDTVLNLGMTDAVAAGLAAKTGNARFAYDSYRRFLDLYGSVVAGVPHGAFEAELDALKLERGAFDDAELGADDLEALVARYKGVYDAHGATFPQDAREQLRQSVAAVFAS